MAAKGLISTAYFILILAFASVLTLVFSLIFNPMFSIMKYGTVRDLLMLLFPRGLLIIIFFVGVAVYYYEIMGNKVTK